MTLIRVFEDLRGLGYAGGYDAVRRYAAAWRRRESAATAPAFVPLSFARARPISLRGSGRSLRPLPVEA